MWYAPIIPSVTPSPSMSPILLPSPSIPVKAPTLPRVGRQPRLWFSLPTEIHQAILAYLSQHDLTVCAQLNRYFNTLCTPLVWKTIHIKSLAKLNQFKRPSSQLALLLNAKYVSYVHLLHKDLFDIFIPPSTLPVPHRHSYTDGIAPIKLERAMPCKNIRHLKVHRFTDGVFHDVCDYPPLASLSSRMQRDLIDLVAGNPKLKSLEVYSQMSSQTLLHLVHNSPTNIRAFYFGCAMNAVVARFLLTYLPGHIKHLVMDSIDSEMDHDKVLNDYLETQFPAVDHSGLEGLYINGDFRGFEEYILMPFLDSCSNLRQFEGPGISCYRIKSIRESLERRGIRLQTLRLRDLHQGSRSEDHSIAHSVKASSRWIQIHLLKCPKAGPLTATALRHRCDYLETVSLDHCPRLTSAHLLLILHHAKVLQKFSTFSYSNRGKHSTTPPLDAVDMLGTDWATTSLRVFVCRVQVPRTLSQMMGPEHATSPEHSRQVQCHFFRQLARQTLLEELRLGTDHGDRKSWQYFQCNSLEMTLQSGLDELRGLDKIRVLDIKLLNHYASIRELEWMQRNWPGLQCVEGICRDMVGAMVINAWRKKAMPGFKIAKPIA
ncbi:hypothetical protein CPB97_008614 [Podila verticillata]|nr:hypothetical protein CPB97_008614 [Podila verticillata]